MNDTNPISSPPETPELALACAAKAAGGIVQLSIKLGLSRAAAAQWRVTPPQHVLRVEEITGVRRERLRPDLYPPTVH